jgi:hypothetical protein
MTNLVERLRSTGALPICPYDKRSPEYYTTPNDKPCKFCGGLPEGPDKCTGGDMRIMAEAADEIERLRALTSPQLHQHGGGVEEARAEQWRLRREAEGSRDAAYAAADSLRMERDAMKAALEKIASPTQTTDLLWWQTEARAALAQQPPSVQEPVKWLIETEDGAFVDLVSTRPNEDAASYYSNKITPLYAAPTVGGKE